MPIFRASSRERLVLLVLAAFAAACEPSAGGKGRGGAGGGGAPVGGSGGTGGGAAGGAGGVAGRGGVGGMAPGSGGTSGASGSGGAGSPGTGGRADGAVTTPGSDARPADGGAGPPSDGAALPPPPSYPPQILPVVFLDVPGVVADPERPNSLGREKRNGTIKVIEDHDGAHADPAALKNRAATLQTTVAVSRRGESSYDFPQVSFSVEIRGPMGNAVEASVAGLPKDEDWALVSCWNDKTCMRHALAYSIGREMGDWHPRTRFVEVYFNGAYRGLYLLAEPPRRGATRTNVAKVADDATMGPEGLSGGYIFRREGGGKSEEPQRQWLSSVPGPDGRLKIMYVYHYPRETVITPAQKDYLHKYVASFEQAMKAPNWADPTSGYRSWIDVRSWGRHFLIHEAAYNIDAFWKSMYFAKEKDSGGVRGKLSVNPVWDFNIAFGNADYRDGWKTDATIRQLQQRYVGECLDSQPVPAGCGSCDQVMRPVWAGQGPPPLRCVNNPYIPFFWERLLGDPGFQNDAKCDFRRLRATAFSLAFIDRTLEAFKAALRPNAVARHFRRWPALRGKVWPNPCEEQFRVSGLPWPNCGPANLGPQEFLDHEVRWLREWVRLRLEWMDRSLPGTCPA